MKRGAGGRVRPDRPGPDPRAAVRAPALRSFEDATFNDFCLAARSGKPKRC